jgi:hypothetical protein
LNQIGFVGAITQNTNTRHKPTMPTTNKQRGRWRKGGKAKKRGRGKQKGEGRENEF